MAEYVPTTQDVREAFAEHQAWRASPTYGKATSRARFDLWITTCEAESLRAYREGLADWIESQGQYVGTVELTQAEIVALLRSGVVPFGCAAAAQVSDTEGGK